MSPSKYLEQNNISGRSVTMPESRKNFRNIYQIIIQNFKFFRCEHLVMPENETNENTSIKLIINVKF